MRLILLLLAMLIGVDGLYYLIPKLKEHGLLLPNRALIRSGVDIALGGACLVVAWLS